LATFVNTVFSVVANRTGENMTKMMKAVQIHQYGKPEVLKLEEIPRPKPGPGELLVRVHAAGVNPVDLKTRAGSGIAGRLGDDPFPFILGWDISGIVEEIGAGVTRFKEGDAVYGMPRFPQIAAAYAEYITAPATELAHKPQSIDHIHAAALPLVSLTAWQAMFEATDLKYGQEILIHAAAGGVGHIAVQLAKWKNAFVIGTASAHNADYLAEIGVDQFVDYRAHHFEDIVSGVDVVLDAMSGDVRQRSWSVLKPGGIMVSILGPPSAETAAQYGVRATNILVHPNERQLAEIAALADSGILKPNVEAVYPLAEAPLAHAHVQKGHTRGKVVLRTD
jgi:NADPH:quinone reductase-like Zn-dependent oxidoreductase